MSSNLSGLMLRVEKWPKLREDIFDAKPQERRSSAYWVAAGIAAHQTKMMNVILQELFDVACRRLHVDSDPGKCTFYLHDHQFASEISTITYDGIDRAKAFELFKKYRAYSNPTGTPDHCVKAIAIEYVCIYLQGVMGL